jgi:hypothetical protein
VSGARPLRPHSVRLNLDASFSTAVKHSIAPEVLRRDRLSERMTVIGNMLHLTGICPDSTTVDDPLFTTDGQTLRMSQVDPDTGFELVVDLTRQP